MHIWGIFGKNLPFFGPKSSVFEIALVSLVGVGIYEKILRPSQSSTLAGMDPLSLVLRGFKHFPPAQLYTTTQKSTGFKHFPPDPPDPVDF